MQEGNKGAKSSCESLNEIMQRNTLRYEKYIEATCISGMVCVENKLEPRRVLEACANTHAHWLGF